MNTKSENKNSELTDLGAFWKKNKNGKNFLSGKLKIGNREFTAFIFSNNKSKPNQPDYRLTVSNLDSDLIPEVVGADKPKAQPVPSDSENQDDIPF
jgi:uncharacterized protein (DUF736 family)